MEQDKTLSENKIKIVFEQYEFKGWLITIENYYSSNELVGFAVPTKYAHLLNYKNYEEIDDIAIKNKIETFINEDGGEYYEDLNYFIADPHDVFIYHFNEVKVESASSVLDYLVKEILQLINPPQNSIERYLGHNRFNDTKYIVLKQIQKKSITPKVSKRKTGFMNQAWSALVKDRDKKCTECGSIYDLHAHHIKSYKSHPELRTDVNNGITLCAGCHRNWHKINGR